jgi:FtsZ-binding cell division protein ZapB
LSTFQLDHLKSILEAANFAKQIRDNVTKIITEHIIGQLSGPVEESQTQLELYTKKVLNKLDEHEILLEVQREQRTTRGFLSATREEHEAEIAGCRITALQEDNEGLKSERDELEGANKKLKEQFEKLRGEKAAWQEKYLDLLGQKRPREEQSDLSGKKHKPDEPNQSPSSSNIATINIANAGTKAHISPQHFTQQQNSTRNSSSSTDSKHLISSGRNYRNRIKEPSDGEKEELRKELGLSYSPWNSNLSKDQLADVTLALWKRELRRRARYVPDYGAE